MSTSQLNNAAALQEQIQQLQAQLQAQLESASLVGLGEVAAALPVSGPAQSELTTSTIPTLTVMTTSTDTISVAMPSIAVDQPATVAGPEAPTSPVSPTNFLGIPPINMELAASSDLSSGQSASPASLPTMAASLSHDSRLPSDLEDHDIDMDSPSASPKQAEATEGSMEGKPSSGEFGLIHLFLTVQMF